VVRRPRRRRLAPCGAEWYWAPASAQLAAQGAVVPSRAGATSAGRARNRCAPPWIIQHGLLLPFTEAMAHPKVEGREWVRELERPCHLRPPTTSTTPTRPLSSTRFRRARDKTVVAAAATTGSSGLLLGNIVSLLIPFPSLDGEGAVPAAQLEPAAQVGLEPRPVSRGQPLAGRPHPEFKPASDTSRTRPGRRWCRCTSAGVPDHCRAGNPCRCPRRSGCETASRWPQPGEGSRQFTGRVEQALRALAREPEQAGDPGRLDREVEGVKPLELLYES